MSETELVQKPKPLVVQDDSQFSLFLDTARFEHGQRVANLLASSMRIPDQFRGNPADCFLMLQMAQQLNMHPVTLMQKSYVVHGKPGMEAQLVIALMNQNGPFEGPVNWRFEGEFNQPGYKCTAFAVHKETKQELSYTLTYEVVKAEGWLSKNGSKWATLGPKMYQYRSAVYLCDLYCPEVKFGYYSIDELEEMGPKKGIPTPDAPAPVEERLAKIVENEAIEPPEPPAEIVLQKPITPETLVPDEPKTRATRRSRCTQCQALYPKEALEVTQKGLVCVKCAMTTMVAPPAPKILPEERYLCQGCDKTFAKPKENGNCIHCLSDKVIDRTPDESN